MPTVCFFSPKGGTGTTTVAAAYALSLADAGFRTMFVDQSRQRDADAVFGIAGADRTQPIKDNLTWVAGGDYTDKGWTGPSDDFRVVDMGVMDEYQYSQSPHWGLKGTRYMVVRADYLCLRAGVKFVPTGNYQIILVAEEGRALRPADVEAALGSEIVATVHHDPVVSRATDAGLLAHRTLSRPLAQLSSLVPARL